MPYAAGSIFCVALAFLAAWIGLDSGMPPAPWGDEEWRSELLLHQAIGILVQPWEPLPSSAHTPAQYARGLLFASMGCIGAWSIRRWTRRKWRQWKITRFGNHILVIEWDKLTEGIVSRWLSKGTPVLVLSNNALVQRTVEDMGAVFQKGSLHEGQQKAEHLSKAQRVALIAGSDVERMSNAIAYANHITDNQREADTDLPMLIHLEDTSLRHSIGEHFSRIGIDSVVRARVFSTAQTSARVLLRNSPWRSHPTKGLGAVSGLLLGSGHLAEAILLQALRCDSLLESDFPEWTIISPEAEAFVEKIGIYAPGLRTVAKISSIAKDPDQAVSALEQLGHIAPNCRVWCFCLEEDQKNLSCASLWYDAWRANSLDGSQSAIKYPVLVLRITDPRIAKTARSLWPEAGVYIFGTIDELIDETISSDQLDDIARGIHESYLAEAISKGEQLGSRSALQPWRSLPEYLKDDNRAAADHHYVKLQATGICLQKDLASAPLEWSSVDFERLARMEHVRWIRQRKLAGWKWGQTRNEASKTHPAMLPYDELDEPVRQLDRDVVTKLPGILEALHLQIARKSTSIVAAASSPWAFSKDLENAASLWLAKAHEASPVIARTVWVVADSALAWRIAEICLDQGLGGVGLIWTEPFPRLLARQPNESTRARMINVARLAVETLEIDQTIRSASDLEHLQGKMRIEHALWMQIYPDQAEPPRSVDILDADGRWVNRSENRT